MINLELVDFSESTIHPDQRTLGAHDVSESGIHHALKDDIYRKEL